MASSEVRIKVRTNLPQGYHIRMWLARLFLRLGARLASTTITLHIGGSA
jgi:hypothetical protein